MPRIATRRLRAALERVDGSTTAADKGRALEEFLCDFLGQIPGIEVVERNALNAFQTEELDIALWNNRHRNGLHFLPHLLLVESKNWSAPVGSVGVNYFASRLRRRGCDHGILMAACGITGRADDLTAAHFELAAALADGVRVIVMTRDELCRMHTTEEFCQIVKRKLCQLVASGTMVP